MAISVRIAWIRDSGTFLTLRRRVEPDLASDEEGSIWRLRDYHSCKERPTCHSTSFQNQGITHDLPQQLPTLTLNRSPLPFHPASESTDYLPGSNMSHKTSAYPQHMTRDSITRPSPRDMLQRTQDQRSQQAFESTKHTLAFPPQNCEFPHTRSSQRTCCQESTTWDTMSFN